MPLKNDLLDALHTSEDELLKHLIRDVEEVFCTMVGMENLLHLPLQVAPETHFKDCITAMVGFAGVYNGLVSLHAPQKLALAFTSSMLGMEVTELNDDVRDALGEIANMIAGSFKQHISPGGTDIKLSTPSLVSGDDYYVNAGNNLDTLTLRFATDEDWFMVAIVLEKE
ncbi:chemotaxis protein CheX [Oryzomonas japonica]|uniref:Chemotaxis protein CheX n=1 Tax=Oryzomonas japonica TaxID=2603858 RepID=A0A7J4ZSB9_9BACT|nr:chemotaxis protein CheX [Oryzomonas japonica]KAB0666178.1 chemotaxis protein CheX [Oryzomonas japonica]